MSTKHMIEINEQEIDLVNGGFNLYEDFSKLLTDNKRTIKVFVEGAARGVTAYAVFTFGWFCFKWISKNWKRASH